MIEIWLGGGGLQQHFNTVPYALTVGDQPRLRKKKSFADLYLP